jgi:hypothetical protein
MAAQSGRKQGLHGVPRARLSNVVKSLVVDVNAEADKLGYSGAVVGSLALALGLNALRDLGTDTDLEAMLEDLAMG